MAILKTWNFFSTMPQSLSRFNIRIKEHEIMQKNIKCKMWLLEMLHFVDGKTTIKNVSISVLRIFRLYALRFFSISVIYFLSLIIFTIAAKNSIGHYFYCMFESMSHTCAFILCKQKLIIFLLNSSDISKKKT